MNWLMIHPEDAPSRPVYLAWLARAGIAGDVISPGQPTPASVGPYNGLLLTGGGDIEPGASVPGGGPGAAMDHSMHGGHQGTKPPPQHDQPNH